jgi:murein L,D-transpeptidase YcbB/YkuD
MNEEMTKEMVQALLFPKLLFRQQYHLKVMDYCRLSSSPNLSEEDADRLEAIMAEAESDEVLNFWLIEVDQILARKLGLLDAEHSASYADQQAWLREYLVPQIQEDLTHNRELQELLRRKKCYQGPVDGVFGKDSVKAVEKFQEQERLKVDGLVGLKTMIKLADTVEEAKKLFTNRLESFDFE